MAALLRFQSFATIRGAGEVHEACGRISAVEIRVVECTEAIRVEHSTEISCNIILQFHMVTLVLRFGQ